MDNGQVIEVDPGRFEEMVASALDGLPEELGRLMSNVAVTVEHGAGPPGLLGLYEERPLDQQDNRVPPGSCPDRITIYRQAILLDLPDRAGRSCFYQESARPLSTRSRTTSASMTGACANWAGSTGAHRHNPQPGQRSARRHDATAFLNENQATTCSRSRAQLRLTSKGSLMLDSTQSSDGVITKPSSKSVPQTIDALRRLIADRGFMLFNVIDHSGVAERAGVQMPDSKLVMFGKPAAGAAVMLAAPLAALDIPLKVLVWEDRNGAVSVSYNSPGFLAGRHHLEGALRAPFDAVESIVEALPGA